MKRVKRIRSAMSLGIGAPVLALALAVALTVYAAPARAAVVTSTVGQSGFAFGLDPVTGLFTGIQGGGSYPLTVDTGYDFAGQDYASLTTIDKLTITLSINDADSDVGDFDFDNLTLGLDGIDTGLKLNGFPATGILTLNIEGPTGAAGLLAKLQEDGRLVGSVIDADSDGFSQANPLEFIGFPFDIQTTLVIEGQGGSPIPLPAAALMAPLGAGLFGMASRRFRRAK
jgi:hypothetical protein